MYGHPPHLDPRWTMGSTNHVHPTQDFHPPQYSSADFYSGLATTQTLQSSRTNDNSASSHREGSTKQLNQHKLDQERVSAYSQKLQDNSIKVLNEQPITIHFPTRAGGKQPVSKTRRTSHWSRDPHAKTSGISVPDSPFPGSREHRVLKM